MATGYNQTPEDRFEKYQAENVGISYTGLIYNLDARYGVSTIYNSDKQRFIELSPNFNNRTFTISTPGDGLFVTNGIGTDSITFTGIGTDYETNDITASIPGIGTDSPSKLTVEMWVKINDLWGYFRSPPAGSGGMLCSFDCYDVFTGGTNYRGTVGFNAFDAKTIGVSTERIRDLKIEGNWAHYVFVMTPYVSNTDIVAQNKIYINTYDQGSLVYLHGFGGNPNNRGFAGGRFKINGNSCGGYSPDYKLNMDVGAVRIYNRELTSEEVIQNYDTTKARYYPKEIVSDGLVLNLDATNSSSVGVGTTWTDLSGNNNATLVSGTYHSDGPFLDAGFVSFDGTDDYISVGSTTDFNIGTSDFTMEGWLLISGNSSTNNQGLRATALFGTYPTSGTITGYSITIIGDETTTGTGLQFANWNAGVQETIITTISISQNEWHHVAACRSGTTTRLFLDGTEVASGTLSNQSVTSPNDMKIGASLYDGFQHYLNGQISNFRIINGTALYTSDFTPPTRLLTAVDNTVLLTCQKETIRDGSIGIHTVTANNGPTANLGFPSSSYEFDGTDDYASLTSAISVTDFTYETWVYHTPSNNASDYGYFFSGQSKGLGISEGGTDGGLSTGDLYYYNGSIVGLVQAVGVGYSLPASQWVHLVAVCDGTSNSIETYTNGSLVSTTSVSNIQTSITELSRYDTGANYLNGKVSGVRVYNDKLTASEVLQNYNATKRNYAQSIITNGLVLKLDAYNKDSYIRSSVNGTTWSDVSGQGNNATLVNGTSFDSNLPRNFVFDGTDDYATADSVLTDSFLQGVWTISFWVKFDTISTAGASLNQDRALLHHGTTFNNKGLHLCQRDGKIHFGLYANDVNSSSTVSTDTWYNVVFTLNNINGVKRIHINGSLDNQHSGSAYTGTGSNARIGGEILFGKNFDGNMAMMNAYNRILTAEEVTYNYNIDKARFGY